MQQIANQVVPQNTQVAVQGRSTMPFPEYSTVASQIQSSMTHSFTNKISYQNENYLSHVLSCSGATKRKKKKPTSFVPPPNLKISSGPNANPLLPPSATQTATAQHLTALQVQQNREIEYVRPSTNNGPMAIPFWKQPLVSPSQNGSSENESSVGSRVNIQQKLQEKKQKQLAELKVIEEEIKQGKLGGPNSRTGTLNSHDDTRQPIPRIKKHDLDSVSAYSNLMMLQSCYTDTSDVDAMAVPLATNNLNSIRAVVSKSKVPRQFHQNLNIQSSSVVPSPIPGSIGEQSLFLDHIHVGTNTTNSNKSSSNQSQTRNFKGVPVNRASPSVHEGQFGFGGNSPMIPTQKMDSHRGTPIQSAHINSPMMHILQRQQQQQHRLTPSEVILSPHPYLEQNQDKFYNSSNTNGNWNASGSGVGAGTLSSEDEEDNTHHPPSDIDSQMSRSYTLPREFKYNRSRKTKKMDNFVPSNNSSDGELIAN